METKVNNKNKKTENRNKNRNRKEIQIEIEGKSMGKLDFKPGNMLYPLPAVMVSVRDKEGMIIL